MSIVMCVLRPEATYQTPCNGGLRMFSRWGGGDPEGDARHTNLNNMCMAANAGLLAWAMQGVDEAALASSRDMGHRIVDQHFAPAKSK
jgi:hypothetical protein